MELEAHIRQAVRAFDQAQLVAVSSGAGMSKESGIATFREAQTGLWSQYDPEDLGTPQAFRRNPDFVWKWYMHRFGLISSAKPHAGHYAVAEMETLFPKVVVLTQNIDGLHTAAGSTDVVELHGNFHRFKCFANCQGNPTLVDLNVLQHDAEHAPHCPHCGDLIRPDVVWFGEMLPETALERAFDVAAECAVMLVVGTSGIVQPAASLPYQAKRHGAVVVEVNLEPSGITPVADIFLQGAAGQVLPALVTALRASREQQI